MLMLVEPKAYPQNLLVFHGGSIRNTNIGMMKLVTTIPLVAMGIGVVLPELYKPDWDWTVVAQSKKVASFLASRD
jgi:hypothetical protein